MMKLLPRRWQRMVLIVIVALGGAPVIAPIMARAQPPERAALPPEEKDKVPALPLVTWDEVEAQIGGATLITLHADKMPALQVFAALDAQTPFKVSALNPSDWPHRAPNEMSASYDAQPFWWVARDVAQKLESKVFGDAYTGVSFLEKGGEASGLDARSGPTVFTIFKAFYHRGMRLGETEKPDTAGQGSLNESLMLEGKVYLDPKLVFPQNAMAIHVDEARDENGQSLIGKADTALSSSRNTIVDFKLYLKPPAQRGGTLKSLRGQFHGVVPFGSLHWEVPDALHSAAVEKVFPQKAGADAVRVEWQPVKKVGEDYQVSIFISQNGALAFGNQRLSTGQNVWLTVSLYDNLKMIDDKNRSLNRSDVKVQSGGDEQTRITNFTATFRPQNSATFPNAKLVLDYYFDWREVVVPFEFENIALP